MAKQWFILHALSGHELKVQKNIASRINQEEMGDNIEEVLIPSVHLSMVRGSEKIDLRSFSSRIQGLSS